MLALQLIAIVLILLSAALMFGPQLVVYGPHGARALAQDSVARFAGGCLSSALVVAAFGPQIGAGVLAGSEAITLTTAGGRSLDLMPL